MNREKYPNYFWLAMLLYLITLVLGVYFITSAINFGLLGIYADQLLAITAIILLPIVFIALYVFSSRIHFLWGKERWIRIIIDILVIIAIIFVSFVLMPLAFV